MKLKPADQMKKVILGIIEKNGKVDEFQKGDEFHLRIENEPYMPLVIERHSDRVMVTHYYNQNGDLIADPDVEFMILGDKWFPAAMQDTFGHTEVLSHNSDTGLFEVATKKYSSVLSFTNMWARNIKAQGF